MGNLSVPRKALPSWTRLRRRICFAPVERLGAYTQSDVWMQKHIDAVVKYPLVDLAAIKAKHFTIVLDAINLTEPGLSRRC